MKNLTDILIDHVFSLSDEVRSTDEYDKAVALALLDYISVTQAGFADLKAHDEFEKTLSCMLLESPESCAMVLGIAAHRLELDDGYRSGGAHIGAPVLSACFASCHDVSWKQLVAAVVCGYELAGILARIMQPTHKRKGFHVSGTCGCMGAAAALAFLDQQDRTQLKRTLSVAAGMASGLLEMQEDGSELKPVTVGNAASSAVMATRLGTTKLRYPADAIGGARGLVACLEGNSARIEEVKAADLLQGTPVIQEVYRKKYPSCRHSHSALDAAQIISSRSGVDPKEIEKIQIDIYEDAIKGHDLKKISSPSQAMMSTPFCVATMFVRGSVGLDSFNEASFENSEVDRIMHLVTMNRDERLSSLAPKARGARVVVKLADGAEFEEEVLFPKGEPENPLTDEEQMGKALSLLCFAGWKWSEASEFAKILLSLKRLPFAQLRANLLKGCGRA